MPPVRTRPTRAKAATAVAAAVLAALAAATATVSVGRSSPQTFPGPAGKIAVWTGGGTGGIELLNPDGSGRLRIADGGDGAVWSPDGRWLAYSTFPEPWVIRVIRADGSGARDVLSAKADAPAVYPAFAWSPNGAEIAYACSTGLCAVRVDDGRTRRLVDVPARTGSGNPSWAPDGSRIAFECTLGRGICIVNLGAPGTIEPLSFTTPDSSRARYPDWSPDSSRLLVSVRTRVYAVSPGQPQAQLVAELGGTLLAHGRWSPDGKSVLLFSFPDLHVLRLDSQQRAKIGTAFAIGDWGTSPAFIVSGARPQPRWALGKQVGTLVLEGTASHTTRLEVTFESARRSYAPVSALAPAGAASTRVELPRDLGPGQYRAAITGGSGTERILPTSVSVLLAAPATGLVSRSWISDRPGGPPRDHVPAGTRALEARFAFSARPAAGQKLTAAWIAPSGVVRLRQRVVSAAVTRSTLKSDSPLPAGRWRCRLEAGTTPLAVAAVRVG